MCSQRASGAARLLSATATMMAPKPRMNTSCSFQTAAIRATTSAMIRTLPMKPGSVWRRGFWVTCSFIVPRSLCAPLVHSGGKAISHYAPTFSQTSWKFHRRLEKEYCRGWVRQAQKRGGKIMPPINFLAVLVAAVAGWLVGAAWYGVLGSQWMAALGRTEDTRRSIPVTPMIIAFIALIVMATMLAGLI